MEENIIINGTTDRISQLPESILHHILSFLLSPADLVRSSVLSKQWLDLTASFPILDFNFCRFTRHSQLIDILSRIPVEILGNSEDLMKKFWKYVDYTICRFYKEDVSGHTLKLRSLITAQKEVDIIDKCIELSIKRGVQVMHIEVVYHSVNITDPLQTCRLPNRLLSASSLTSLTIIFCKLPSSLMTVALKFKSLKKLSLGCIRLDEEMIKHLITSCNLLEEFSIHQCIGFKRVCIYGHPNLQKVRIDYWPEVEKIDIEAPNIRHLSLLDYESHVAPSMNLALCKNLTTLCFCGYFSLNTNGFGDFLTNFPFIENLVLTTPQHCNNLKLSSNTLRTLVLHSQCQLDVIEINTPNLLLFNYSCNTIWSEPCVMNSVESKVCMECYPNGDVDTLWFHKLRQFLDDHYMFKVLKLHIRATLIDVEELKVIKSPPFEVEHVELELGIIKELSVYLGVVEAVLWCCRPKSLTLISEFYSIDFEERNRVIKCTYERLLEQEDQSHTNTNYIQIVSSFSSKTKNRFSDMDSLLRALPCYPKGLKVTFIKEQGALHFSFNQLFNLIEITHSVPLLFTSKQLSKKKEWYWYSQIQRYIFACGDGSSNLNLYSEEIRHRS